MKVGAIQPILAAATHVSAGRANANVIRKYTQVADGYYAPPVTEPSGNSFAAPQRPFTLALHHPKSAGVFSYLFAPRKAGGPGGGKIHGAAFRAPAQAVAEPPPMTGMEHGDARVDAIHDDSRKDNPLTPDRAQRTRTPTVTVQSGAPAAVSAASVSYASAADDSARRAIQERKRAILTMFGADFYHAFSGAYSGYST